MQLKLPTLQIFLKQFIILQFRVFATEISLMEIEPQKPTKVLPMGKVLTPHLNLINLRFGPKLFSQLESMIIKKAN